MQCKSRHKRHSVYSHVRAVLCRRSKSDETRRGSHLAGYCHGKRPVTTDCLRTVLVTLILRIRLRGIPKTKLISVLSLQRLVFVTSNLFVSYRLASNPMWLKNTVQEHWFALVTTGTGGGGGGGDSYMKGAGMLVVSFRGVNFGFWSHLGCSGQNAIIFSREGLV